MTITKQPRCTETDTVEGVIEQFTWLSTDSALAVLKVLYTGPQELQTLNLISLPEHKQPLF